MKKDIRELDLDAIKNIDSDKDLSKKIKIDQVENLSNIPHQTKQGDQKGFER